MGEAPTSVSTLAVDGHRGAGHRDLGHVDLQSVLMESMSTQIARMTEDVKELKATMQRIESRMEQIEERKSDDSDPTLSNIVGQLQKKVNRLLSGGAVYTDSEEDQFRKWVEQTVGLPQYYDLFVENGVEKLSVVQMFTIKELTMIGITKI